MQRFQTQFADLVVVIVQTQFDRREKDRILFDVQQTIETIGMLFAQRRDQFVITRADRRNFQQIFTLKNRQTDDQTVKNDVAHVHLGETGRIRRRVVRREIDEIFGEKMIQTVQQRVNVCVQIFVGVDFSALLAVIAFGEDL